MTCKPHYTVTKRRTVMNKTFGLCWYCGELATTIDHFYPRKRKKVHRLLQSRNRVLNLLPACDPCNQAKRNLLLEEYRQKVSATRFYGETVLPPAPTERQFLNLIYPTIRFLEAATNVSVTGGYPTLKTETAKLDFLLKSALSF
jgi:hypothetical protein